MEQIEQKKRKKKKQNTIVLTEEISVSGQQLIEYMDKLESEKTCLDVQICPKCKSPKVKRVGTMDGDLWGNMGLVSPKHECSDCGWLGSLFIKNTTRPLTVRDVELIAEALEEK